MPTASQPLTPPVEDVPADDGQRLLVVLSWPLYEALHRRAAEEGRTLADVMREALSVHLAASAGGAA